MKAVLILMFCLFAVPIAGTILLQFFGAVTATGIATRAREEERAVGRAGWRIVDRSRPASASGVRPSPDRSR